MHNTQARRHLSVIEETKRLDAQIAALQERRQRIWHAAAAQVGREFAASYEAFLDLIEFADVFRASYGHGYTRIWNRYIPHIISTLAGKARLLELSKPNSEDGTYWTGSLPLLGEVYAPRAGQAVVYALYDADDRLLYIGSTEQFKTRIAWHQRDKPAAVSWDAVMCTSRTQAYEVEKGFLRRLRPPMNRWLPL